MKNTLFDAAPSLLMRKPNGMPYTPALSQFDIAKAVADEKQKREDAAREEAEASANHAQMDAHMSTEPLNCDWWGDCAA